MGLKERLNWKEKPCWVKFGLFTLILFTLIFLLSGGGIKTCKMGVVCKTTFLESLTTLISTPIEFLLNIVHSFDILVYMVLIMYYFGIGAFIGWFYSKLKSRNK